ncbi:MAG: PHP domain-containing protein, partial [Planctomycetota bacterium]
MRSKRTLCALALLLAGAACTTTRWYKGNLHTHSLWSDGNDFPEMIADWYKKNGYDFLALSDHNILSEGEKWVSDATVARRGGDPTLARYLKRFGKDWVETREKDETLEIRLKTLAELRPLVEEPGKFLMIRGEEITDRLERLPIHLNASNLAELIPPQHGKTVREVMRNNVRAVQQQSEKLGRPILVHLNHPNFGWAITAEDLAAIERKM